MASLRKYKRFIDAYRFAELVRGIFGNSSARVFTLIRRSKKRSAGNVVERNGLVRPYDTARSRSVLWPLAHLCGVRSSSTSVSPLLQSETGATRLSCRPSVLHEAFCLVRRAPLPIEHKDVAEELDLDWQTVKALDKQYMQAQLERAGTPGPQAIGIDEISIRKGHNYRIVVSDLRGWPRAIRHRPIWFGGEDRSQASMNQFYDWLGEKKAQGIRLALMDMWKLFHNATAQRAPQAAILFDKFHVIRHLNDALDKIRKAECASSGKGSALHQGPEVCLAEQPSKPDRRRQKILENLAGSKQAARHGLSAQGILRPTVAMVTARLG